MAINSERIRDELIKDGVSEITITSLYLDGGSNRNHDIIADGRGTRV